jgi:cysteinyl-tRNA synthetase
MSEVEANLWTEAEALKTKYNAAMEDDFNTSDAIAAIFELVKLANTYTSGESSKQFVEKLHDLIVSLSSVLGLETKKEEELLDTDIEQLIEERQAARKNKDFARSDEIRNLLLEKGIVLEDTREGVRWKRS